MNMIKKGLVVLLLSVICLTGLIFIYVDIDFHMNDAVSRNVVVYMTTKTEISKPSSEKSSTSYADTELIKNKSKAFDTENDLTLYTDQQLNMSKYANSKPLIPHIIHQYWDSYDQVPKVFINYIRTVVKHHPGWEYWFWTNKDVDCYFKTIHKEFYNMFEKYKYPIMKADAMRYFILYDYGGVYMDLDVEVLKPVDIWTYVSACILSHENYEHSFLIHKKSRPNLINAVMACRPKHVFFKMLQESLIHYYEIYKEDLLHSTGPFFMDDIFHKFKEFGGGSLVNVVNPVYWFPTYNPGKKGNMQQYCNVKLNQTTGQTLLTIQKLICLQKFTNAKDMNKPDARSYLNHHWVHSNLQPPSFKTENVQSVFTVAPNLVNVSERLKLVCHD